MSRPRLTMSLALLAAALALSSALPQGRDPREAPAPQREAPALQKSTNPKRPREQTFAARGQAVDKLLSKYLASEEMARQLVNCFDGPCADKQVLRLIADMRKLKDGGQCQRCDPKEQEIINKLLYKHVSFFQKEYRAEFTRLLPKIARLIL